MIVHALNHPENNLGRLKSEAIRIEPDVFYGVYLILNKLFMIPFTSSIMMI